MYNYKEGKNRVEEILSNKLEIKDNDYLPKTDNLTFDNAYYSWVGSIFIDIRDSSALFKDADNENISKIMKCFTSELIEILRGSSNLRDIGIRGDCVYAIYTSPLKKDTYDLYLKAAYCNTYINMLNKLLTKYNLLNLKVGIGLGESKALVIKAGRKNVGINDNIWIGNSVIDASNFSSIANTKGFKNIVMSPVFYKYLTDEHEKAKSFFTKHSSNYGDCYSGDVIMADFNDWINNDFSD